MTRYSKTTEETLITFHTGRGGRFNNAGHVRYVDQDMTISSYTDNLFVTGENFRDLARKFGDRPNLIRLLEEADNDNTAARERLEKWGFDLGKQIYTDCNGNPVGLDFDNDGTGEIDEDGLYDTTVVMLLKDCSENELQLILDSNNYVSADVRAYCEEKLSIESE